MTDDQDIQFESAARALIVATHEAAQGIIVIVERMRLEVSNDERDALKKLAGHFANITAAVALCGKDRSGQQ